MSRLDPGAGKQTKRDFLDALKTGSPVYQEAEDHPDELRAVDELIREGKARLTYDWKWNPVTLSKVRRVDLSHNLKVK